MRGTAGGAVLAPDAMTSGRDLNGGGGGPLVGARGEDVADCGGARFQLGSQLTWEAGALEYRSRVFVILVTLASLAFSALAFSSATGGRHEDLGSERRRGRRLLTIYHRISPCCGLIGPRAIDVRFDVEYVWQKQLVDDRSMGYDAER